MSCITQASAVAFAAFLLCLVRSLLACAKLDSQEIGYRCAHDMRCGIWYIINSLVKNVFKRPASPDAAGKDSEDGGQKGCH